MSYSTGINYFYDFLGLDRSNFKIFYDFSSGNNTSTRINSVPLAESGYSGTAISINTINNSGLFAGSINNRIKINNVNQNVFSDEFSFIFKFKPATLDYPQVLFGSLTGAGFKSGFKIGINQANNIYFQYYDNVGPVILTSQTRLSDTNLVGVNIARNNIGINWYNSNTRQLEVENFFIDSQYLLFSDQWHLGASILTNDNPDYFSGYYGGFLAFNNSLSKNAMTRLMSGFYAYPALLPAVSGEIVTTGIVGYTSSTPVSGVTGFTYAFSEFLNEYYPIYDVSTVSGTLFSGVGLAPIYGPITGYYQISPARSGLGIISNYLAELGYDSLTYSALSITGGFSEIYTNTGLQTINTINKFGVYDIVKGDFSADAFYTSGNCDAFLNGVFQVESGYVNTGQFFNSGKSGIADYFIENQYFDFKEPIFLADTLIYDNNLQQNRIISSYTGQKNIVINGVSVNVFNNVFYNGQKLISGTAYDYITSGANTIVISNEFSSRFSGTSGTILITSGFQNTNKITGIQSFYKQKKFLPETTQYYLNGIRQPKEHFIEHSYLSPISGNYIFAENLVLINNNDIDDWV